MNKPEELKKIEDLRKVYENIEIPSQLSQVVNDALRESVSSTIKVNEDIGVIKMNEQKKKSYNKKTIYRTAGSIAAALAICTGVFAYGIHSNEAFATSMRGVPILGSLVQVFTGEAVNNANDIYELKMALPKVEGLTDQAVENRINKEITQKMNAIVEESKTRMIEDKKAYMETGGTEEEYKQRLPEIVVDYEVKNISDDYLSFLVSKTETSASAYFEQYYYNINLKTNEDVQLQDLLGDEYMTIANEQITAQITERAKEEGAVYWGFGADDNTIDGFTTISEKQNFYVNEAKNPVIVFNKYEIGPGSMGIQEFEIKLPASSDQL